MKRRKNKMKVKISYDTKSDETECRIQMTGRELVVNFVKNVYKCMAPGSFKRLVDVLASEELLSEEEAMKLECYTPDAVWGKGWE